MTGSEALAVAAGTIECHDKFIPPVGSGHQLFQMEIVLGAHQLDARHVNGAFERMIYTAQRETERMGLVIDGYELAAVAGQAFEEAFCPCRVADDATHLCLQAQFFSRPRTPAPNLI